MSNHPDPNLQTTTKLISRWLVQKDQEIEALKKQVKSITKWKVHAETQAREIIKRLGRTIPSLAQIEAAINKTKEWNLLLKME